MARKKPLQVPTLEQLVDAVEDYLQRSGCAEWKLGHDVCGDPNLVRELRGGRSVSLVMAGKIAQRIQQ